MRADVMPWEGNGHIVTIDDKPIGGTMWKEDAMRVARWLNDGGLQEIESNAFVDAREAVTTVSTEAVRASLGKTVGGR